MCEEGNPSNFYMNLKNNTSSFHKLGEVLEKLEQKGQLSKVEAVLSDLFESEIKELFLGKLNRHKSGQFNSQTAVLPFSAKVKLDGF